MRIIKLRKPCVICGNRYFINNRKYKHWSKNHEFECIKCLYKSISQGIAFIFKNDSYNKTKKKVQMWKSILSQT